MEAQKWQPGAATVGDSDATQGSNYPRGLNVCFLQNQEHYSFVQTSDYTTTGELRNH